MRIANLTVLLGLASLLFATLPPSCSTKAVGIDECRRIEEARCEAAIECPEEFDVRTSADVAACKRFYHDHCLHGLDVSDAPGKPKVTDCVDSIQRLGRCAKSNGAASLITECDSLTSSDLDVTRVCGALYHPQVLKSCSFLIDPDDGSGGNGGNGGSAGDSGGSGGAGGDGGSGGS
jgi:uncharacterized membrane protein YgcG